MLGANRVGVVRGGARGLREGPPDGGEQLVAGDVSANVVHLLEPDRIVDNAAWAAARYCTDQLAPRRPGPTLIRPLRPVSPDARGSSRSSRAKDCAAAR